MSTSHAAGCCVCLAGAPAGATLHRGSAQQPRHHAPTHWRKAINRSHIPLSHSHTCSLYTPQQPLLRWQQVPPVPV